MFPLFCSEGWRVELEWFGVLTECILKIICVRQGENDVNYEMLYSIDKTFIATHDFASFPVSPGKILGFIFRLHGKTSSIDTLSIRAFLSRTDSSHIERQIPIYSGSCNQSFPAIVPYYLPALDHINSVVGLNIVIPNITGANLSYSLTAAGIYLIDSLYFKFATSSTAGNRYMILNIVDSVGSTFFSIYDDNAIPASTNVFFCFLKGFSQIAGSATQRVLPLPDTLVHGEVLNTAISNLKAGDVLSAICLRLKAL